MSGAAAASPRGGDMPDLLEPLVVAVEQREALEAEERKAAEAERERAARAETLREQFDLRAWR
jgi:hypothetical protein